MMLRSFWLTSTAIAFCSFGCVYSQRSTSLSASAANVKDSAVPPYLSRIQIERASIPLYKRGALAWDDDGPPDVFVRIYRKDEKIWQSEVVPDSLSPEFSVTTPQNIPLSPDEELRIEMWDDDGLTADLVGVWKQSGFPERILMHADTSIEFDGGATMFIRLLPPATYRGLGVASYLARGNELEVIEVLKYSPAGRAGLKSGDKIILINGHPVRWMTEIEAASALSMAGYKSGTLTVKREEKGEAEILRIDGGPAWPVL